MYAGLHLFPVESTSVNLGLPPYNPHHKGMRLLGSYLASLTLMLHTQVHFMLHTAAHFMLHTAAVLKLLALWWGTLIIVMKSYLLEVYIRFY